MSKKIVCKYCRVDLSNATTFSTSGKEPNEHHFCTECIPMMRLVSDCVKDAINERVLFAFAKINELFTQPERLNGKISSRLQQLINEENAKV